MPLPQDLLSQAYHLATVDKGRPKQANLRRAISSAYYAVFHRLVSEAVHTLAPKRPKALSERVARAFSHGEMKQACGLFLRVPLPSVLSKMVGKTISNEMQMLAEIFLELQEARHSADYDPSEVLTRATVLARLSEAERAFWAWNCMRNTDEATVFLAALAFGARWSK